MKDKILKGFALLLIIAAALMLAVNVFYLLSGGGVYWNPGGQFMAPSLMIRGWFDLQLGSKLHVPFLAKALVLLFAFAIVWLRGREFMRNERIPRWVVWSLPGVGIIFALIGLGLLLMGKNQHEFIFENGSALNYAVTITLILIAAFIGKGALGLINRDRDAYWMMAGFFLLGICNEIGNLLVVIAVPFLISHLLPRWYLSGWYVRLALEAVLYLALFSGALLLLAWLRNEFAGASAGESEKAFSKSGLGLR